MSAYASNEKSAPPKISRIGSLLTNGWKKKLFSFVAVTKKKKTNHTTKQQPLREPLQETPTPTTAEETTTETISSDEKVTEINTSQLSAAIAHITLHEVYILLLFIITIIIYHMIFT